MLAVDIKDGRSGDLAVQVGLVCGIDVGTEHRKADFADKGGQVGGAIVELVVADGHRLVTQFVHKLRSLSALVLVEEQGALELVARIQEDDVGAVLAVAPAIDLSGAAGNAADAAAFGLGLFTAGGGRAVVLLDVRMGVVGVQDGQRKAAIVLRHRRRCTDEQPDD